MIQIFYYNDKTIITIIANNIWYFFSVSNDKAFDPFEMGDFSRSATSQDIENAIGLLDKRILEMKVYSRVIYFLLFNIWFGFRRDLAVESALEMTTSLWKA